MKKMSLVLGALDSFAEVEDVIAHVQRQTIRDDLELVVVCHSLERLNDVNGAVRASADQLIEARTDALHEARAKGVRASTSPYVAVLEDHCCPDPGWAAALLTRLSEGWAAVGPVFRPANPPGALSQAMHLVCYGQWLEPLRAREANVIAGHNCAYRKDVLVNRAKLARDMGLPVVMQQELKRDGHRFYLESDARMRHWDASRWRGAMVTLRSLGHALGFRRAADRHIAVRLAMACTMPVLVGARWGRSVRTWRRGRRLHRFRWQVPIYQLVLAAVWSVVECWAYVFAETDGLMALSDIERNRRRFLHAGEWPRLPTGRRA